MIRMDKHPVQLGYHHNPYPSRFLVPDWVPLLRPCLPLTVFRLGPDFSPLPIPLPLPLPFGLGVADLPFPSPLPGGFHGQVKAVWSSFCLPPWKSARTNRGLKHLSVHQYGATLKFAIHHSGRTPAASYALCAPQISMLAGFICR